MNPLKRFTVDASASLARSLSPSEEELFATHGYIVLKAAVARDQALQLGRSILAYCRVGCASLTNTTDWLAAVYMFHHPLQWALRQNERIYGAFAQLHNDYRLWVSIDRGKVVPPIDAGGSLRQGFIHWDINTLDLPSPIPLQGLVALSDSVSGSGGFQCVPGFPRNFEDWVKTQPASRNPFCPNIDEREIVSIEMEAGDVVIWSALLPHGNGPNFSHAPRIAQLLRMYPCSPYSTAVREKRLQMWREKLPRHPSYHIPSHWGEPELSLLGKRLVGLETW